MSTWDLESRPATAYDIRRVENEIVSLSCEVGTLRDELFHRERLTQETLDEARSAATWLRNIFWLALMWFWLWVLVS